MSYNWTLVRSASTDPLSLRLNAMANKQNIAENEIFKPERASPKIISRSTEDLCLVQDPFSFQQLKSINLHYYGPFEPDGVHLKYWCRFNHMATRIRDCSFSKNHTVPVGSPKLCKGPSDGVKAGTIVTRLNTGDTTDYLYTPDNDNMQIVNMGSGFSIFMSFMMEGIGMSGIGQILNDGIKPLGFKTPGFKLTGSISSLNNEDSMLRMKIDDTAGDNGYMIKVGTAGELKFIVRRAGTTRSFISPQNKITLGLFYYICLTYDMSNNSMTMRINNEPQSDVANDSPTFPSGHSLSMFHGIGTSQNKERMRGRIQDSRTYNDMIFSGTQMDNIWNNKRSISPIQYGNLSVAGIARFNSSVFTIGYDSIGYDSTGFTTT